MAEKKKTKRSPAPPPAPRITKVYTRGGDRGTTGLVGGHRVKKSDPRIEAYGVVDELMVWIGMARAALAKEAAVSRQLGPAFALLGDHLRYHQNLLFTVNSDLATRIEDRWPGMPLADAGDVAATEKLIDAYNASLPPLADFILPSGGEPTLALHACRVVCRRAERAVQTLADREATGEFVLPYLNRLSDLFFVLARWASAESRAAGREGPETIWKRDLAIPPLPAKAGGRRG